VTNFDRIKPRATKADAQPKSPVPSQRGDREGKRALFSAPAPVISAIPFGALNLSCSSCGATTAMTAGQVLSAAIPSLHLLGFRKYPSWMRCPACRQRNWVRVSMRRR
jgi:hypothetical protein